MTAATPRPRRATLLFLVIVATACTQPKGPYLGQPAPGETPTLFAPGTVNTDAIEINGVLSPDGTEFFFTRTVADVFTLHHSVRNQDDTWSKPSPLHLYPNRARALAVDMHLSPDGRRLYFLGQYVPGGATDRQALDLWVSTRGDDGWSTAERLPPPVTTDAAEFYPVVVADGSLYFSSVRDDGFGDGDVYRAQRLPDGSFAEPVNLGPPINTEHGEGDTFVSPDESYLIVSSRRPGGLGASDLYIAWRNADGSWGEPVSLGPPFNTEHTDFCPMVTPDGKYFFFSRRTGDSWAEATAGDVYWVDARVLERFRP